MFIYKNVGYVQPNLLLASPNSYNALHQFQVSAGVPSSSALPGEHGCSEPLSIEADSSAWL